MTSDEQLNHYLSNARTPNVANQPSHTEVSRAKSTSLGYGTRTNIGRGTQARQVRGSWEGYMNAPSAQIQMNGTGYISERAQVARKAPKGSPNLSTKRASSKNVMKSNVFDYRYTGSSPTNSVNRLKKAMRLNKMF